MPAGFDCFERLAGLDFSGLEGPDFSGLEGPYFSGLEGSDFSTAGLEGLDFSALDSSTAGLEGWEFSTTAVAGVDTATRLPEDSASSSGLLLLLFLVGTGAESFLAAASKPLACNAAMTSSTFAWASLESLGAICAEQSAPTALDPVKDEFAFTLNQGVNFTGMPRVHEHTHTCEKM